MTIREYLIRRCNYTAAGTVAFLVASGALVSSGPEIFILRFILAVLMAAVSLAAVLSLFQIPCPKCRRSLGRVGFWVANGQASKATARCPHCGISVDEQCPDPPRR